MFVCALVLKQGWAHYGPRAGSGPRGFLVWPAEESLIFDIIDIIDIKEHILEVGIIYYLGKFIPYYCRLQECDADWIINCSLMQNMCENNKKVSTTSVKVSLHRPITSYYARAAVSF